jgi:N-acetylmuramoyl-L-alanine amidase
MTGVWRAATKLGVVIAITLLAAGLQELRAQQRAQSASQAGSESCARASFRVVVDVGHTVDVPGAMSARGIPEYAFNLQLAREIKQALVDAGFEQSVLLITTTAPGGAWWSALRAPTACTRNSSSPSTTIPCPTI